MYKVVKEFYDLQDGTSTKAGTIYHHYKVGDEYPRQGKRPSNARIEELASNTNALGEPLIEEVKRRRKKAEQVSE